MLEANTTVEQIRQLQSREVQAETLVNRALEKVEAFRDLNAFIAIDADQALMQAREVDNARRSGTSLPTLAGLPIAIKDNIDVEGWVTSGATPALAALKATRTAPVVRSLQDAGAIVLGKTNLHELAFGITNTNFGPTFPPTYNPHDPRHITGGSSGGTAAAIAAGIVTAGLGTDTSGSIRIPAAFCGVAGLRPSVGNGGKERRYPLAGLLPISHTNDTAGPMATTVADLALLDMVITGEPMAQAVRLKGLRLGRPECFWTSLDPEVEAVCQGLCRRLEDQGVVLVDLSIPDLRGLLEKISAPVVLHEALRDIPEYLATHGCYHLSIREIHRQISNPDVKAAFDIIISNGLDHAYQEALSIHRPALRKLYEDTFRDTVLDALIFPTVPIAAPRVDLTTAFPKIDIPSAGTLPVFNTCIRNTDPAANAGLPGLSLQIATTSAGLPVGIEIDSWVGRDRDLLGIGIGIEEIGFFR